MHDYLGVRVAEVAGVGRAEARAPDQAGNTAMEGGGS